MTLTGTATPVEEVDPEEDLLDSRRRFFDIRVADHGAPREEAGILLDRMYATRGYISNGLSHRVNDRRMTLVASEGETVVGTLTLGVDHGDGLLVDEIFGVETQRMRDDGLKLCEFTKLAIDGAMKSRRLIASLFHCAYIFAHPLLGADRLLIEVNPRHVNYYRRMLGFEVVGASRDNPRVSAPAVLMSLAPDHARCQIDAVGGSGMTGASESRSLYPFVFSPVEEHEILERAREHLPADWQELADRHAFESPMYRYAGAHGCAAPTLLA